MGGGIGRGRGSNVGPEKESWLGSSHLFGRKTGSKQNRWGLEVG